MQVLNMGEKKYNSVYS